MNGTVLKVVTSLWKNGTLYRPALAITYNTNNTAAPPAPIYPVNLTSVRRVWWVGLAGDDDWNSGHQALPLRSPARALTLALPGDSIYLMTGVYGGKGVDGDWLNVCGTNSLVRKDKVKGCCGRGCVGL